MAKQWNISEFTPKQRVWENSQSNRVCSPFGLGVFPLKHLGLVWGLGFLPVKNGWSWQQVSPNLMCKSGTCPEVPRHKFKILIVVWKTFQHVCSSKVVKFECVLSGMTHDLTGVHLDLSYLMHYHQDMSLYLSRFWILGSKLADFSKNIKHVCNPPDLFRLPAFPEQIIQELSKIVMTSKLALIGTKIGNMEQLL